MFFIDCHTHVWLHNIVPEELIKGMNTFDVHEIVAISTIPPDNNTKKPTVKESVDYLFNLCRQTEDRVIPFVWINPLLDSCYSDIEYAIVKKGFRGIKLIPAGWAPYDEKLCRLYEYIEPMRIPILFHSGISLVGNTSRNCRPVNYEVMAEYPNIKFSLAHCSWPWTDECIALAGKFNSLANPHGLNALMKGRVANQRQMFIDLSPGIPEHLRKKLLETLFLFPKYNLSDQIMFGSDMMLNGYCKDSTTRNLKEFDKKILNDISVSEEIQDKYFYKNFRKFTGDL